MESKESLAKQNFKETLIIQIIRLVGMIILGFFAGYLVYRDSVKKEDPQISYLWFVFVLCSAVGIIMFIINVSKAYKSYKISEDKKIG